MKLFGLFIDARILQWFVLLGLLGLGALICGLTLWLFAWPRYVRTRIDAYTNGELTRLNKINELKDEKINRLTHRLEGHDRILRSARSLLIVDYKPIGEDEWIEN
jgi:hypothetical protein